MWAGLGVGGGGGLESDTEITFTRPSWGVKEGDAEMRAEEVEGRRDRD